MHCVLGGRTDIRGVFYSLDVLARKLCEHVEELVNTSTRYRSMEDGITTRNLCCKQIKFKCFQKLTSILCQTSLPEAIAKQQLIDYCGLANTFEEFGDKDQLVEFQNNYSANNSIYWYTRESFLFRILCKAMRQWDVDVLLNFGFYISDLNEQLRQLQKQQFSSLINTKMRVYRGQFMNIDELRKFQSAIGGYISINTFLSTTKDYHFALRYIQSQTSMYENVLFVIDIDMNDDEITPFAYIDKFSAFRDTSEILISIGTVFRIDSIQSITDVDRSTGYWEIYLTVCHNSSNIIDTDDFDLVLLYMVDILSHLSSRTEKINEKMFQRCRLYCAGNDVELLKLDHFKTNYCANDAIREYTKDTFLYRVLNRALRTQDMGIILDLRYFVLDLYKQLYQVQTDFDRYPISVMEERKLIVFRGQLMRMRELKRLKRHIGRYIITHTFLSTTISSEIALVYTGDGAQRPLYESVLFEIHVNIRSSIRKRPFANISKFSQMKDENEVLFSVGTIFQVNSVEKLTDKIWILCLQLYDDDNREIDEIEKYIKLILLLTANNQLAFHRKR